VIIFTFFTYFMIFLFIDHNEMLKCNVGRIMTKLMQCHSVWTSYPTLLIYDEIRLLSWMQCDLWQNLWRNWHNIIVFGLHIRLHIHCCESMTKSDCSSWSMICDKIKKHHGNFVTNQGISCSVCLWLPSASTHAFSAPSTPPLDMLESLALPTSRSLDMKV
jgi:hypothetical protein